VAAGARIGSPRQLKTVLQDVRRQATYNAMLCRHVANLHAHAMKTIAETENASQSQRPERQEHRMAAQRQIKDGGHPEAVQQL
jgi:hypothetical protein